MCLKIKKKGNIKITMLFKKIGILLIIISLQLMGSIVLKHHAINTYTNTTAIEKNTMNLKASNFATTTLTALRVGYRQYSNPAVSASSLMLDNRLFLSDTMTSDVYGDPLVFPNPMKLTEDAILGYWLNQSSDITIQIYDLLGRKIFSQFLISGMSGARMGYNKLVINAATFSYFDLSAGVYFLFIFDETNNMIGKTKFAIVP